MKVKNNIYCYIIFMIISLFLNCTTVEFQKNKGCLTGDCNNGFGIKRYGRNGDLLYIGEWINGKSYGTGTYLYFDYHNKIYGKTIGNWSDNSLVRKDFSINSIVTTLGVIEYSLNNKSEKGIIKGYYKINDVRYIGDMTKIIVNKKLSREPLRAFYYPYLLPTGNGKIIWKDGSSFEGRFGCTGHGFEGNYNYIDCGIPSGIGKYTFANGDSISGHFKSKIDAYPFQNINKIKHSHIGSIANIQGKIIGKYILKINKLNGLIIFKFDKIQLIE